MEHVEKFDKHAKLLYLIFISFFIFQDLSDMFRSVSLRWLLKTKKIRKR